MRRVKQPRPPPPSGSLRMSKLVRVPQGMGLFCKHEKRPSRFQNFRVEIKTSLRYASHSQKEVQNVEIGTPPLPRLIAGDLLPPLHSWDSRALARTGIFPDISTPRGRKQARNKLTRHASWPLHHTPFTTRLQAAAFVPHRQNQHRHLNLTPPRSNSGYETPGTCSQLAWSRLQASLIITLLNRRVSFRRRLL